MDRNTGRIYAVTTADSAEDANSVVLIDSMLGRVTAAVPLALPAQSIALSKDGAYLYALYTAFPSVVIRINTDTMAIEAQYPLDLPGCSTCRVQQILPLPGSGRSYIALFLSGNITEAVAVFDDDQLRSKIVGKPDPPISALLQGPEDGLIYGYNGLSTLWGITRMAVTGDGIETLGPTPVVSPSGFLSPLLVSRGLLYGSNGTVMDIERGTYAGQFYAADFLAGHPFAIDEKAHRIYFSSRYNYGITYLAFDLRTFLPISRLRIENPGSGELEMPFAPVRMLLTREGDLVVFDGKQSRMVFIPTGSLAAFEEIPIPRLETVSPGVSYLRTPANWIVADPHTQLLYLSTPGWAPGIGNRVLVLDPRSGTVSRSFFAGSQPDRLAVSAGGRYLYVSVVSERAIQRYSLPESAPDLKIQLRSVGWSGRPVQATHILPLPSNDESIVVVQGTMGEHVAAGYNGTLVYDGGKLRPRFVEAGFDGNVTSAALSADGTRLYGLQSVGTGFEFTRLRIEDDGVSPDKTVPHFAVWFDESLQCDDSICATSAGTVFDGKGPSRFSRIPDGGLAIPDRARGVAYVLRGAGASSLLLEYDLRTARLLRGIALPMPGPFWSFMRYGDDRFGVVTDAGVWLFSSSDLSPPPAPQPPAVSSNGVTRTIDLRTSSLAYDRQRNLLYAAVPGFVAGYGNMVVAIDPASGRLVKSIVAGSDPSLLRISDDARYLYAGLRTGDAVLRIDLASWKSDALFPLGGSPNTLSIRPRHARSFAVATDAGPLIGFSSSGPYEPGLWLWEGERRLPLSAFANGGPGWGFFVDENTIAADSRLVRLSAAGLTEEPRRVPVFTGVAVAEKLVFGNGTIHDAATLELRHALDETGAVLPAPERNRVYYLHLAPDRSKSIEIRVYELSTLRVLGAIPFRNSDTPAELVACGPECLAVRSDTSVILVSTAGIIWSDAERRAVRNATGWRLPIRLSGLFFDPGSKRLYATTAPDDGKLGNSLVSLRASDGTIEDVTFVGTAPGEFAFSEDGSAVAVGLRGQRAIWKMNLKTKQGALIPLPTLGIEDDYRPEGVTIMPGRPDTIAVTAAMGNSFWRVGLLADRKMFGAWLQPGFNMPSGRDIYFTPDGERLQVIGTGAGGGVWSLPVTSTGLAATPPLTWVDWRMVARCSAYVLDTAGKILDAGTLSPVATIPVADRAGSEIIRTVACDESRDRVYYMVSNLRVLSYRLSTREFVGSVETPRRSGTAFRMVSAGDAGVAYWIGNDDPVWYMRDDLPQPDELIVLSAP